MEASSLIQFKISQAAFLLFEEKGFENTSMSDIAVSASIDESDLYTYFGNTHDITLFLFQCINNDWQIKVQEIKESKFAERFEQALILKLNLVLPYTSLLGTMMGLLLKNSKIGIQSARTIHIRTQGLQVIQTIIDGASDAKKLRKSIDQLPSIMYLLHWIVLFLHIQTNDKTKTEESIRMIMKMLKKVNSMSYFIQFFPFFKDAGTLAENVLSTEVLDKNIISNAILKIIFNNRKLVDPESTCHENACKDCLNIHRSKIEYFTQQNKPIHLILPAFPAKSPNLQKVLGVLPDLGEEIALRALEDLCLEIGSVYAPGAELTICSDGRIFSELVGVADHTVTNYVNSVKKLIASQDLKRVKIVNLEDIMVDGSFEEMRKKVIQNYAEPIEELKEKLKINKEFKTLFNGIHRFVTDDRKAITPDLSISKIKEQAKEIALQVIQHSNAWTRLLAYVFPDAIRLSIHPYEPHSEKIGIKLTKATDNWLTPWHGVIVLQKDDYLLMKKETAEQLGATLIFKENQPYYYTLNSKQ